MSEKTPQAETPEDATATEKDRATLQRQAYGAATKRLREQNRDQFNTFMAEEAKALGIDWSPRPTEEEKAKQALEALLAAHPHLREQV